MRRIKLSSRLGRVTLQILSDSPNGATELIALYSAHTDDARARRNILTVLASLRSEEVGAFFRREYPRLEIPEEKDLVLGSLSPPRL